MRFEGHPIYFLSCAVPCFQESVQSAALGPEPQSSSASSPSPVIIRAITFTIVITKKAQHLLSPYAYVALWAMFGTDLSR